MVAQTLLTLMLLTGTDQTIQVQKGTRLEVHSFAGEVSIKTWDKDAVRVEAEHSDRETIDIRPGDRVLVVRSRSDMGIQRSLDYTLTVPSWMAISVSGNFTDVTMEGVGGDVSVDTTRGDVTVSGGSGFVSLKSVQGAVSLEKAKGRIDVRSVNDNVHLADVSGDVSAETTNGSIVLDRIDSSNVDIYTVNGNVSYDGPLKDKGAYRLTTHNGRIDMTVAEKANAAIIVRSYNGGFQSTFPVKLDEQDTKRRFTLTVGNGGAHVELESFGGQIALRRPGDPRPATERNRRRSPSPPAPPQPPTPPRLRDQREQIDRAIDKVKGEIDRVDSDAVDKAIEKAKAAIEKMKEKDFR